MAIITISRGSYSRGTEIARKVAACLGYECVGREALLEASEQFNIPETKLVRAVHDAPSIFDRFVHGKEKYIAYIQAALVHRVKNDNVVYHGLAGHFLLRGIDHVLKVRVTADLADRVAVVMQRDNVNEKDAIKTLRDDDEQRKKWSQYLYGIDTTDPSLYDLMLHINKISVEGAVDIICMAARAESFKTTPQSQKAMDDLALECDVRSRLIAIKPDVEVQADGGTVFLRISAPPARQEALNREMKALVGSMPGVNAVEVETYGVTPYASED